ncbi:hypothetical protein EA658_09665 [Pseudoxanthomonas winnipegensis]|jgi:hypothetical protein|uniref:Secreted protein n=1 Tax=Pseudoxanthomonas winnipegensis TaxID=2480810 RepID=A0ABY1WGU9_9GAMM|nr:hypothetical protein [Pseudoxanthomonas winnipegensis]TAA08182.1 hypothetical protein EA659_15960 [Pseudoxanthomonas winnipegensis]TAA21173.1 hypothetical protein EA658_09665 [Pseudoxanthomonas winnipegensis]TAH72643.1 hypothetical protein EA657_10385 [Pseudoxanthomonas winnipegensis]WJI14556.1 hypothetical protein MWN52_13040 [Pseudoxanthomonas winnipegensis]
MTRTQPRLFAAPALLFALAACSPSDSRTDMNAVTSSTAEHGGAVASARNPAPKDAYRITMTIKDAPGPFAWMKALAQYDVVNKECLSPPKDNPGGRTAPVPTDDVEIPLQKISETEYVGTVYADQMLDQDYTGRGVCHWKLIQFRVHMKATGAHAETLFIPSIPDDKLLAGSPENVYFNRVTYPEAEGVEDYPDTGGGRSDYGPSVQDQDLFTVTFTPVKDDAK